MPTHRRPPGAGPGRPKGSKSRNKEAVAEVCARLGCNPIEGLIRVATDLAKAKKQTLGSRKLEAWCYAELAQYCYPKLKAVEHSGTVVHDLPLAIMQGPEPPA
jgi:hypothetical protein